MSEPRIVSIPLHTDVRGTVGVVEGEGSLPFVPQRFYFLTEIPAEAQRGFHAHRRLEQIILPLAGGLVVDLDDGREVRTYALSHPGLGLHVPPGFWRVLREFALGTVVGVLASEPYDESDYIRDYDAFVEFAHA